MRVAWDDCSPDEGTWSSYLLCVQKHLSLTLGQMCQLQMFGTDIFHWHLVPWNT